jgi:hypothetical protein
MSAHYDITANYLIKHNFRPIHAGDDYDHAFTIERVGLPLDLTSAKIWFTIKEDENDSDAEAKLQYDTDSITEIEVTDILNGKFVIHLRSADTLSLKGTWLYDIKTKLGTGKILHISRGVIEFLPSITLATA